MDLIDKLQVLESFDLLDHLSILFFFLFIKFSCCVFSYIQLDQNDLTDIRLAIQCGHTSTIEKLVSEGADLNVQSTDGQTCLHKAIKLCYNNETIVQETDTLRKVNTNNETDTRPTRAAPLIL